MFPQSRIKIKQWPASPFLLSLATLLLPSCFKSLSFSQALVILGYSPFFPTQFSVSLNKLHLHFKAGVQKKNQGICAVCSFLLLFPCQFRTSAAASVLELMRAETPEKHNISIPKHAGPKLGLNAISLLPANLRN